MSGRCTNSECPAPLHCHEGNEDIKQCEFWIEKKTKEHEKKIIKKRSSTVKMPWTGKAFLIDDLNQISRRNAPIFFGIVGRAGAGKTTFLAMLYTLLLNGRTLKNYSFAGSKTILEWDELYSRLKVQNEKVSFPNTTPSEYSRILHLAIRDSEKKLNDIFLNDTSGEVFSLWSQNREEVNAENARWVYKNANGFILFIDCEDLIERKNSAKSEIIDIAQMLKYDIQDRPIIAVWSKADKKREVNTIIKDSLKEELEAIFSNYSELDISNFSKEDPDELVHENNLKVIDWLLCRVLVENGAELIPERIKTDDLFLNYRR